MIGRHIGQYVVESQLGAGGMGVVYRAFDNRLKRPVAIKVFPDLAASQKARQRMMNEARSASALNHPNICTVHEVGESEDTLYLVMECVEGQSLAALVRAGGLSIETALEYGAQIAGALAHAHARGVVHRDLKCANVVVTPEGHAKVLDFGLARRTMQSTETETETHVNDSSLSGGSVAGTLTSMAPEALRGELVDGRADIWALGVMLYEMASGKLPFVGQTAFEVSGLILHGTLAPLPETVPPGLRAVIARCLEKEPLRRYQDAADVRAALQSIGSIVVTPSGRAGVVRETVKERRSLVVLPFTNLPADPESDYFADGLTEEIIADLSSVRQLRVISSTSSMRLKGSTSTLTELSRQLRVDYVLEGSVRRGAEGKLRITAKLIEASTDSPVWGNKYSGSLEDVFAIQEALSRSIVDALRVVLTADEDRKLKERPIADVRAYEWYLRAKQEMLRFTTESLDRALSYLDKAEAIAGESVVLFAAKGEAYWQYVNSGLSADAAYLDRADASVARALAIDPESVEGHRVAGLVLVHRGDMQGALGRLKRSLDHAPTDPDSLLWGSLAAGLSGKMALAEAWAAQLVEVDPVTPFFQLLPGMMAWFTGDYDRAFAQWSERLAAVRENPALRLIHGHLAVLTGRAEAGDRILDELAREAPDNPFGQLAAVYRHALAGDREKVVAGLTPELVGLLSGDPQYCLFLGHCHALVGDVDGGIRWIEAAATRGFINHDRLARLDPFLATLRGDPRFEALMRDVRRRSDAIEI